MNSIVDAVNGLEVGTFFKLKKHGEDTGNQEDPIRQTARSGE